MKTILSKKEKKYWDLSVEIANKWVKIRNADCKESASYFACTRASDRWGVYNHIGVDVFIRRFIPEMWCDCKDEIETTIDEFQEMKKELYEYYMTANEVVKLLKEQIK